MQVSQKSSGPFSAQLRAFANIRAHVRLPTPSGPVKSSPCGNRCSRSLVRSRSMTLAFPMKSSNRTLKSQCLKDVAVNFLDGAVGRYHSDTLRFAGREIEIAIPDPLVEGDIFHLESSFIFTSLTVAGACSRQSDFGLDVEQDCDFRAAFSAHQV